MNKGLFTLDTRTEFNVHWSHSHFALTIRFGVMRIEGAFNPILLWRWIGTKIGTEFIVYTIKSRTVKP